MFFSKPSFTAIAFDSGGVATGPMTVTFIMAMAIGAADAIDGRNSVTDGFGLIALVALAPIIMVMLLGFLYPAEDTEEEIYDEYRIPDNGEEAALFALEDSSHSPIEDNDQTGNEDREEILNEPRF
jgi:hypothetical protein